MDPEGDWLAALNLQLQRTIIDLQLKLQLDAERRSIKQLFSMGCGFTGRIEENN